MPFLQLLLPLLSNLIPSVVNKVLPPDKMSEEDKAKLQMELTIAIMAQDWKSIEAQYDDRKDARNLASQDIAKGNAFTSILAAMIRPAWGFGALALVTYSVIKSAPISAPLQEIIQTVLFFYFGGRTIEKVIPHVTQAYTMKGNNNGTGDNNN